MSRPETLFSFHFLILTRGAAYVWGVGSVWMAQHVRHVCYFYIMPGIYPTGLQQELEKYHLNDIGDADIKILHAKMYFTIMYAGGIFPV